MLLTQQLGMQSALNLAELRISAAGFHDIAQPPTNKVDFELFCLAVSAINGCEACVRAHEQVVVEGGLGEEHVHDAVRIAAVVSAAAVALEI
jgi:lipoyl-dependent peroxiredoxin subunit D